MRTFDELYEDLQKMASSYDTAGLRGVAEELDALGTPSSAAAAELARGWVCLSTGDTERGVTHFDRAIEQYEAQSNTTGIAHVTETKGRMLITLGRYEEALKAFESSLALANELDNRGAVAAQTGYLGLVHSYMGNFAEAFEYINRSIQMYEDRGSKHGVGVSMLELGNIYQQIADFPRALETYQKALMLYEEIGNEEGVMLIIGNLGKVYWRIGDHDRAIDHMHRAAEGMKKFGNPINIAESTDSLGVVYRSAGEYEKALQEFTSALKVFKDLADRHGTCRLLINIIDIHFAIGSTEHIASLLEEVRTVLVDDPTIKGGYHLVRAQYMEEVGDLDGAHEAYMQALTIVTNAGIRDQAIEAHRRLRDLAQKRNDFAAYIEHNDAFARINEEVNGKEATQKLAMLEAERAIEAERRERDRERAVLYSALPQHIADRVVRGEDVSGDQVEDAAILFLDVVGFTSHSSQLPPSTVTKLLGQIFHHFDEICTRHDIIKVKTIGDSYMAAALDHGPKNAKILAGAAMEMLNSPFTWPDEGNEVLFRIGLHVGPVVAGVLGTQRLQYDVWGDTVNVASRMESTGEPGRIQVSEAFADALKVEPGTWNLELRGATQIKGKGTMQTYWLSAS
jgi:adenylate cyclase